jgi:hypothetical protein
MPEADAPNPGNPIHSTDSAKNTAIAPLVGGATIYGWCVAPILDAAGMHGSQPAGPTSRFADRCFPTICSR